MPKIGKTPKMARNKPRRCVRCKKPLNSFAAYIPDEGEACLKCYTEYAKGKEVLLKMLPEKGKE